MISTSRQRAARHARSTVIAALALACLPFAASGQQAPPAPPVVEAGFGRGITVRSADNQMSVNIRARAQIRFTGAGTDDGRPSTTEFLVRRMRLLLQGNAMGPALTYYLQLGFSNLDTEPDLRLPLRDAYVTWAAARDVNIRVGQMKVPFGRQRVVSSSALQMVDRSVVVSELNLDRDVGVQVFSRNLFGTGTIGYALGLFGGEGRNRLGRAAGSLYTARIETYPFGAFDDLVEADIRREPKLRLALGGGVAHNQHTNRVRSTIGDTYPAGDVSYTHAAVDGMLKTHGVSIIGEVLYRDADQERQTVRVSGAPVVIEARSGWGAYLQGGVMVSPTVELNARAGRLMPAPDTSRAFVRTNEHAFGLSYYPREHNLKLQIDYTRLTAPVAPRTSQQVRAQLQLYF